MDIDGILNAGRYRDEILRLIVVPFIHDYQTHCVYLVMKCIYIYIYIYIHTLTGALLGTPVNTWQHLNAFRHLDVVKMTC